MSFTNCEICGRVIPAAESSTGVFLKTYCGCDLNVNNHPKAAQCDSGKPSLSKHWGEMNMKIRPETEKTPKGADVPEFRTNAEQMKSLGWEDTGNGWFKHTVTGENVRVSAQGYCQPISQ